MICPHMNGFGSCKCVCCLLFGASHENQNKQLQNKVPHNLNTQSTLIMALLMIGPAWILGRGNAHIGPHMMDEWILPALTTLAGIPYSNPTTLQQTSNKKEKMIIKINTETDRTPTFNSCSKYPQEGSNSAELRIFAGISNDPIQ